MRLKEAKNADAIPSPSITLRANNTIEFIVYQAKKYNTRYCFNSIMTNTITVIPSKIDSGKLTISSPPNKSANLLKHNSRILSHEADYPLVSGSKKPSIPTASRVFLLSVHLKVLLSFPWVNLRAEHIPFNLFRFDEVFEDVLS